MLITAVLRRTVVTAKRFDLMDFLSGVRLLEHKNNRKSLSRKSSSVGGRLGESGINKEFEWELKLGFVRIGVSGAVREMTRSGK